MRYDTKIKFCDSSPRKYNPHTSLYEGGTKVIAEYIANVTNLGIDRQMQIFGELKEDQKVVRLMEDPPKKWSFILIDGKDKHYTLSSELKVLKGCAIIIGGTNV